MNAPAPRKKRWRLRAAALLLLAAAVALNATEFPCHLLPVWPFLIIEVFLLGSLAAVGRKIDKKKQEKVIRHLTRMLR